MIEEIDGITLIGTAHVSKKSADLVSSTIHKLKPEVVAVELDKGRLEGLIEKSRHKENKKGKPIPARTLIKQVGVFGFLFLKISGYLQQRMGKILNIDPGVDMLSGVNTAKELQIPLCLADKPILLTIAGFKKLSFLQKMSMIKRLVFSKMDLNTRKDLAQKLQSGNLDDETINYVITQIKDEVPEIYDILIHQRNVYMANKLIHLRKTGIQNMVLVIGAGHLPGIKEILEQKLPKGIKKEMGNHNQTVVSFKMD